MGFSGYDNTLTARTELPAGLATDQAVLSLGVQNLACSRNDQLLFSGVSFSVNAGQLLMIEGANGSGKTSLLRTLCGFILPEEGEVLWQGTNIRECMDDYLAHLCYVGHNNGVKHGLSCAENLKIAAALAGSNQPLNASAVLQPFGLGEYIHTPAQMLSSGQRRRLALARLAISHATVWILDEPFTSLDDKGKCFIGDRMQQHLQAGGIIVLTSHEPVELGVSMLRIRL